MSRENNGLDFIPIIWWAQGWMKGCRNGSKRGVEEGSKMLTLEQREKKNLTTEGEFPNTSGDSCHLLPLACSSK